MVNRKNKILFIFIGIIVLFSLVSLACAIPLVNSPAPSQEILASQESAVSAEPDPDPYPDPDPDPYPDPDPDPESPQVEGSVEPSNKPAPVLEGEPLTMLAKGFGQTDQEVGVSFIAENPNKNIAYKDSQYQYAIYDAKGTVVKTDGGYIDLILPGQQLGIGASLYLDEGVTAARVEVQLNAGEAVESKLSDTFKSEKVTYMPSEYTPSVSGVITNPYSKDLTYLRISAIVYNSAGDIIGGGETYLSFLLANSTVGVIVPVVSNGDVSRVEIFPALSGLEELEISEQLPEGASNLVLSKQGFGQDESYIGFAMIIKNPNPGYVIEGSMYHLTAYSDDDVVLSVYDGYIDLFLPDQILGIAANLYTDEGVIVSRIDAQLKTGTFTASKVIPTLTSENVNFLPDEYSPEVTGEILSPYNKDITYVQVIAIAYNEAGDIIGSGSTYLDFIPANAKAAVTVSMTVAETPAKVELYAFATSLSDIE